MSFAISPPSVTNGVFWIAASLLRRIYELYDDITDGASLLGHMTLRHFLCMTIYGAWLLAFSNI